MSRKNKKGVEKPAEALPAAAQRKPPELMLSMSAEDALNIELSGDPAGLMEASGNAHVTEGLIAQMALLGSRGKKLDAAASNFALGFLDAMKPKDAAEALLFAQMAAIHQAAMMLARRLNHVQTLPQQDAAERALNKLARTFAAQMDTLKRYRSKGQQVVRVERVTVESGAQAVVGTVHHGGRGSDES